MYTTMERERIREALVDRAHAEAGISGAALVGSAARGLQDEWSDIDLAVQLAPGADEATAVDDWSAWLDAEFSVADFFDVFAAGGVRYRVFLLTSSLQIDVSFWPHEQFRATDDGFQLIFGKSAAATLPSAPDLDSIIGLGWLYALHARSALARGRLWQAVMMLDDLRDQIIALMCVRQALNPWHGREVDRLRSGDRFLLEMARAADVTQDSLRESKRRLIALFLAEVEHQDPGRAASLTEALAILSA